jgi:hypothetical protein
MGWPEMDGGRGWRCGIMGGWGAGGIKMNWYT